MEGRETVILITTALVSALIGGLSYRYLEKHLSKGNGVKNACTKESEEEGKKERENSSSEESGDEGADDFQAAHFDKIRNDYTLLSGKFKMVLCVNMCLQMGKGKIAAQCGHATLGAYRIASIHCKSALKSWLYFGQAKIALKVENDEKLLQLEKKATELGLVTCLIQDAGHTQIAAGSRTCLAIGPAPCEVIDSITGDLKLL